MRLPEARNKARKEAVRAAQELHSALAANGITLPSLDVERADPFIGVVLVDLGRARPDVVRKLAEALMRGTAQ